jgi:hypothetical protein
MLRRWNARYDTMKEPWRFLTFFGPLSVLLAVLFAWPAAQPLVLVVLAAAFIFRASR